MSRLYINIGTEKCCLFVKMSTFLLNRLERYPLLFYAVEESLECAKLNYYGIGIIAFSQLLNLFNEQTPPERHEVAHEFLTVRPSRCNFDRIVGQFKDAAEACSDRECARCDDVATFESKIAARWAAFIEAHHGAQ